MSTGVPSKVRVALAHAALQVIADARNIEILHIKGLAVDESIGRAGRGGTDADVLVRPGHIPEMQSALAANGWTLTSTFTWGSPFEHAATYRHDLWGYADIHRYFPGMSAHPTAAFDRLWSDRRTQVIAQVSCAVPSVPGQTLILVLNAARSAGSQHRHRDVEIAWDSAPPDRRAMVLGLVSELRAEVAFAAGTGELELYRGRREYHLWRIASQGGTRAEEWVARVKAAPTIRQSVGIALRAPMVNTDHLAARLGRRPARPEVVREFFSRLGRGVVEESRALARRFRDDK